MSRFRHLSPLITLLITVTAAVVVQVPTAQADSEFDCSADVLFIGARGSGQSYEAATQGMGGQVFSAYGQVAGRLAQETPKAKVDGIPVDYPALPVGSLADVPTPYFDGLQEGVSQTLQTLRGWASRPACSHQDVILAGYSQGAMVMHRVLRQLTDGTYGDIPNRVAGALLIADGDKLDSDNLSVLGSAPKNSHGVGSEFNLLSGTRLDKLPPPWTAKRVFSICTKGDAVCGATTAPSAVLLAQGGADIHGRSYYNDPDVAKAVKQIKVSYAPKVDSSTTRVSGVAGTSVAHQIVTAVGPGCGYSWSKKGKWPNWVSLAPTGVVDANPPTAYSASVQALVTSTCFERRSIVSPVTIRLDIAAPGSAPVDVGPIASWQYGVGDITSTVNGSVYVVKCCKPRQVSVLRRDAAREQILSFPQFEKGKGTARIDASDVGGVVVATTRNTKDANGLETVPNADVELLSPGATKAIPLPTISNFRMYDIAIDNNQVIYSSGVKMSVSGSAGVLLRWGPGAKSWEEVDAGFAANGAIRRLDVGPSGDVYYLDDRGDLRSTGSSRLLSGKDISEFTLMRDGAVLYESGYDVFYLAPGAEEGALLDTSALRSRYAMEATSDGSVFFLVFGQASPAPSRVVKVPASFYR